MGNGYGMTPSTPCAAAVALEPLKFGQIVDNTAATWIPSALQPLQFHACRDMQNSSTVSCLHTCRSLPVPLLSAALDVERLAVLQQPGVPRPPGLLSIQLLNCAVLQGRESIMSPSAQNFTTDLAPTVTGPVNLGPVGTRPDWILYAVPGSAFLLGLCLFSLALRVNRQRQREGPRTAVSGWCFSPLVSPAAIERHAFQRQRKMQRQAEHSYSNNRANGFCSSSRDTSVDVLKARSVETISYENVEAVIYSNQQGFSYRVAMDDKDDYLTPDHCDATNPPDRQTNTDGESYENMYAQPRRATGTGSAEEDDYVNAESGKPAALEDYEKEEEEDQGDYLCPGKEDTDGESYEDMDGTVALRRAHAVTCHEEEGEKERSCARPRVKRYTRVCSCLQIPTRGWTASIHGASEALTASSMPGETSATRGGDCERHGQEAAVDCGTSCQTAAFSLLVFSTFTAKKERKRSSVLYNVTLNMRRLAIILIQNMQTDVRVNNPFLDVGQQGA
ncbi:uncharacterized protein LOC108941569 isoform X2 [Scleropages formosus]|uniref:uncharacterized protein LOC108941569 isoform X2 n=1 Tax=Scleropages formosus TaxID=113540 RepID=UPI0010FAC19D|nr:uncharacterized protein LOC108941569 isoform X2 [Scleropages formosus]